MDADTSRRRAGQTKSARAPRPSNGTAAFMGWIVAELSGYGLLAVLASDQQSSTCTGLCFSEREIIVWLGLVFGFWVLLAQVILGLALTARFHRGGMGPVAAGSAAFFSTLAVVVAVIGFLVAAQQ